MLEYEINKKIEYNEDLDKKWSFLQYVYRLWSNPEFSKESLKIKETRDVTHTIYLNLSEMEFILYIYYLDIDKVCLRGKNADCVVNYESGEVNMKFYDRLLFQEMNSVLADMETFEFAQKPTFDFTTYFYIPERDSEFYYKLISFIYYLSEVDVPNNGIKICDRCGNFQTYNSLKFPHDNLDKFLYYDGNIFIGSHSQNNMIIVYNLPKNKLLEIRRWCMEY